MDKKKPELPVGGKINITCVETANYGGIDACRRCVFHQKLTGCPLECRGEYRKDGKNVIYKLDKI